MNLQDVTALITAIAVLVTAIGGAIAAVKIQRNVTKGNEQTTAVQHQLNSAKDADDQYRQDLREALQDAGVRIPTDQRLDNDAVPGKASRD